MAKMVAERTVFWSWQTDSPAKGNRDLVKRALEKACDRQASETVDAPRVDAATVGVPGSPDIAETIFAKIDAADIFVADVTIIGTANGRPTPNPNVLIELGYARAVLGLERVIMVMNTAFGEVEDLPFDIRGKRVVKYRSEPDDSDRATPRKQLEKDLSRLLSVALPEHKPDASTRVEGVEDLPFQPGDDLGDVRFVADGAPYRAVWRPAGPGIEFVRMAPQTDLALSRSKLKALFSETQSPIPYELGGITISISNVANRRGYSRFSLPTRSQDGDGHVGDLVLLENNGTLWLLSGYCVYNEGDQGAVLPRRGRRFVEFIERGRSFFELHLNAPALNLTMGIIGLRDTVLELPRDHFPHRFSARCHVDAVTTEPAALGYGQAATEHVNTFLTSLWEAYGESRPSGY